MASFRMKGILFSMMAGTAIGVFAAGDSQRFLDLIIPSAHAEEAAALDAAGVKKIINEHLKENPTIVYEALTEYQKIREKEEKKKSEDLIKNQQSELYDTDITPIAGNPEGDITVVEFFDYNCGYCKRAFNQLNDLIAADSNVRVMLKEFPILGASSQIASQAAVAVFLTDKDKYFDVHSKLMQKRLKSKELVLKELVSHGFDKDKISKKMESKEVAEILNKNSALGRKIGISGTPAFVIGGRFVPGAIGLDQMQAIIKEERAAAKK